MGHYMIGNTFKVNTIASYQKEREKKNPQQVLSKKPTFYKVTLSCRDALAMHYHFDRYEFINYAMDMDKYSDIFKWLFSSSSQKEKMNEKLE